jgi:predicted RNA binding protein YcfA (HicA-like mRNA interferase family)/predicted RNase H-like HicB family nuclease
VKVRDIIKMIEAEDWYLVATKGSHRQYKHPTKSGRVTIAGHPNHDLAIGTLNSILKQAKLEGGKVIMYRFLVVIEKANGNYSAYSPDLPGCIATGETQEETEQNIYEAIQMHLKGLLEDNLPVPESQSFAEYIAVH